MNLSDERDVIYDRSADPDRLDHIYDGLYHMRHSAAMDEGEDLRTCLICVTNSLLNLMAYMKAQRLNGPE